MSESENISQLVESSNNNNELVENNAKIGGDKSDNTSPSSGVSSASSSVQAASKQSGIKPPSRIGRPCGGVHKPAVPATPTKYSSDDSIRRVTDDFGRHRLTDLLEADESEEDGSPYLRSSSRRKRYSSIGSAASSMDGLWDLHPRRLSEAGLSRHSDSSAVLTEDTDSFIIGQRVWVGGTKPGTIAYIGETQFAPGDWAGIALDEPIGKNDGSVAGTRYFQCENKKGVFSRLTRLTRVPLEQPGMGSNETFVHSTPVNNGVRRSPISPTGSTRSLLKSSVSLSNSNTSLASTATTHVDFKVGDRVIIKSTQGSKVGTVRYMGLTDFAPGEWVGVELDDPRGKNDGSVEGKRYFECRPNFGLFAPISKVSKSPSKYKPGGSCVVHAGPGLPPSGLKRANSKESMTSMASRTSAASSVRRVRLGVTSLTPKRVPPKTPATPMPTLTALQDVLKEKQQHIEQLLKERDLERSEITKVATQADEAEHRLIAVEHEYEQYRAECEAKLREHLDLLAQLKADRAELVAQLEDEKRKNEDLLFKFEEAAITKGDIEANILAQSVTNESHLNKIKDLESKLAEEHVKADRVEVLSNKLFEVEENLIKSRDEVETLKREVEEGRKRLSIEEEERNASAELIASLNEQIEDFKRVSDEKSEIIDKLRQELSIVTAENTILKQKLGEFSATIKEFSGKCESKDGEIAVLKAELAQTGAELKEKQESCVSVEGKHTELAKENDKLKMELSAKAHDLETNLEKLAVKETEIVTINNDLESIKIELGAKVAELERYRNNLNAVEDSSKKEIEHIRDNLKGKVAEVEEVKKQSEIALLQKNQQLEVANKTITENAGEIEKLTNQLVEVKKLLQQSANEQSERFLKQIEERDGKLQSLSWEIQHKNEELANYATVHSKLESEIADKNSQMDRFTSEIDSLKSQQIASQQETAQLSAQLTELKLTNGGLERQLQATQDQINELNNTKQRLLGEIETIISSKGESMSQLEHLRQEIEDKDKKIDQIRAEFVEKLEISERLKQEHELKLGIKEQLLQDLDKIKNELEEKLKLALQGEVALKERHESTIVELNKTKDELRTRVMELEKSLQEKELLLVNTQSKASDGENLHQAELLKTREELSGTIQTCQEKINTLTAESDKLREELARKSEEIVELNAKFSQILAQSQQTEHGLKQTHLDNVKKFEFELNEKNIKLEQTMVELSALKDSLKNNTGDLQSKEVKIGELSKDVEKGNVLIKQLQEQLASAQKTQEELVKTQELTHNKHQEELLKLREELTKKSEEITATNTKLAQIQTETLQTENETKQSHLETVNKLELELKEKNATLEQTSTELSALKDSLKSNNSDLLGKDARISELSNEVEKGQISIKQLQEQLVTAQTLQDETMKEREVNQKKYQDLQDQVKILSEKMHKSEEIHQSLESKHSQFTHLIGQLRITEKQQQECIKKLGESKGGVDKSALIELVRKIGIDSDAETVGKLSNLEKELEVAKVNLVERNRQFETQAVEIAKLQSELRKVKEVPVQERQTPLDDTFVKPHPYQQLVQDKEQAESQIRFLNSIIADIQRKNEEQKARIEILESGYSPAMADELKLSAVSIGPRQIAPRVYCDICEEFDMHETEDCPHQTTDLGPEPTDNGEKKQVPTRDYCEICEMFGHDTQDCQEDQTF